MEGSSKATSQLGVKESGLIGDVCLGPRDGVCWYPGHVEQQTEFQS